MGGKTCSILTHLWEDSRLLIPSHTHTTHTHAGNTYSERLIGKLWRNVPYKIHCLEASFATAQSIAVKIAETEKKIADLEAQKAVLKEQREALKLEQIRFDLKEIGLPALMTGDQLIWHSCMALAYAEKHKQARWVAHIILPDVTEGIVSRSNDFRPDSLVTTGSAVEADYFLKYLQTDSSYKYDGFGYDRGHLAPSADFRWSAKALSER